MYLYPKCCVVGRDVGVLRLLCLLFKLTKVNIDSVLFSLSTLQHVNIPNNKLCVIYTHDNKSQLFKYLNIPLYRNLHCVLLALFTLCHSIIMFFTKAEFY